MTPEELLKPRYKLLADYPGNLYPIGFVFDNEDAVRMQEWIFSKYPHLFKKLEWWEDRKPEDMPQYVKVKLTGYVLPEKFCSNLFAVIPATEQEYLNQKRIKDNQAISVNESRSTVYGPGIDKENVYPEVRIVDTTTSSTLFKKTPKKPTK